MTLLDRYLFGQFAKNLLLVLTGLVAVYLLVDFFERIDEFIRAQKTIAAAGKYLLLEIPFMIEQLAPVAILLGGVITLGVLNHNTELTALKAAGISLARITVPIVLCGVVFTGLVLAMSQWLLPSTMATTNRILYEEVRGEIPNGIYRHGRYYYKGADGFYSFSGHDPGADRYENFSYSTWNADYQARLLLSADRAFWHDQQWTFEDCRTKKMSGPGDFIVEFHRRLVLALPETPASFFIPKYKLNEMSLSELFARSWSAAETGDPEAGLKFHGRLSYIFLGLPLLLLGLPLLLLVHQRWGRDLAVAVPVSCCLAFAAWGLWAVAQSLAGGNYVNPGLGSWSIHLLVGGLGIWLLSRQDK